MWVGVCLSVLVELVPEKLRTTGVGFYFFIISNIGGNMQVIVPPIQTAIKSAFNLTEIQAFRGNLKLFMSIYLFVFVKRTSFIT
jgi:MFS transporter, Spinster family, sphingosine-1-phosphate transporter